MPDVIDINCDMGEGAGSDAQLMSFITSANIACGYHAGDAKLMRATLVLAREKGVAVGAHPGFADREHFGRRALPLSAQEAYDLVLPQIEVLAAIAADEGMAVQHVKPHGALYNMVAADDALADAIARAVHDADPRLLLFGLAGSCSIAAAQRRGLRALNEAFADRGYLATGSLAPRSRPGALVHDAIEAATRAVRMVREGRLRSVDGGDIDIVADTLCIHGDGAHAVEIARALRSTFDREGIESRSPGRNA